MGEHRADGSYVVSRRGAESAGHSKQFDCFGALDALYDRLPEAFDAEAVGRAADSPLSGGRRHLVLRHLTEHPSFDCELDARQPLRARKGSSAEERPTNADVLEVVPTD